MESRLRARELRNLKTGWIESGLATGPILLFLHGFPDSPETWDFQVRYFGERFQIICPYTRGALPSESSGSIERHTQESLALDLLQILHQVDPSHERPIFCIGHDLGAVHAWNLAPLLSHRLRGLVILNGLALKQMLARITSPRQHLKSWYIYLMNIPYLPEFLATHFSKKLLAFAYSQGGLSEELRPDFKDAHRYIVEPLKQYRAFTKEIPKLFGTKIQKIHCPTLILWGSRDRFLLSPIMEEFESFTSNVTIRILDGNHWIHRECAEEVNTLLDTFLKKAGF